MGEPSLTFKSPLAEGEVVVWGDDARGQITEGHIATNGKPFWKVAPGGATQCLAIRMDGIPVLWGNGPLPPGAKETDTTRTGILRLTLTPGAQYIDVALGVSHALCLRSDGKIDVSGEFAVAVGPNGKDPKVLPEDAHAKFVQVSAGGAFCLAIDDSGGLYQWGAGRGNEPRVEIGFKEIRARNDYCLALDLNGDLYGWGSNALFDPPPLQYDIGQPLRLVGWTWNTQENNRQGYWFHKGPFKAIAAGNIQKDLVPVYPHILALEPNGTVVGWGRNTFGERMPPDVKFDAIAAGRGYSVGLDRNGEVHHWGLKGSASAATGLADVPRGPFASIGAGTMQVTAVRPNSSPPRFAPRFGRGTEGISQISRDTERIQP